MRLLQIKFIAIFAILVMFSQISNAEDYCKRFENNYQTFYAAGQALDKAEAILRGMNVQCQDDWRSCNDAYHQYVVAVQSFTNIFNQAVGNRCRRCNLRNVYYLAQGLDTIRDMLYRRGDYSMRGPSNASMVKSYMHDPICRPEYNGNGNGNSLNKYALWLHPKDRACCAGDWNGVAPYVYHGTLSKNMKQGAIVLKKFDSERKMIDWVCSHKINRSVYQSRLWTKIGGYVVKDIPCK